MLKKLRLERFKNFKEAEIILGPLTLLEGTNASGKSNIRDAFRFLHGISRGYSLAEIFGEKWSEGGVLQWQGIRGGTREAAFQGLPTFALEIAFTFNRYSQDHEAHYRIEIDVSKSDKGPRMIAERLVVSGYEPFIFDVHPEPSATSRRDPLYLIARINKRNTQGRGSRQQIRFINTKPVLSQFTEHPDAEELPNIRSLVHEALYALSSMRFLDLNPDAMRRPSIPGQTILGDRGENLSSVLQGICENPERKKALIQWIQELTPMDALDFEFPADQTGKILTTLIEENGQRISAYSASDGTLRFLAMIAALLGPEPARFYFFEELENGIHPTRLHLLLQLVERNVSEGHIQIVATTHSPQLLRLLSAKTLEHASVIYRLAGSPDARVKRILDIPDARRIIEEQDLARLHASGWLEDAVAFLDNQEA